MGYMDEIVPNVYRLVPSVCFSCIHLENDGTWEDAYPIIYYCKLGVFFPTKKLTCKRRTEKTQFNYDCRLGGL